MEINPFNDDYFMKEALKEAHKAYSIDEVPVGAIIVAKNIDSLAPILIPASKTITVTGCTFGIGLIKILPMIPKSAKRPKITNL